LLTSFGAIYSATLKELMGRSLAVLSLISLCGGCVERTLTVRTDPPGALVYLHDQEVGRTPFSKRFIWYGTYDVQIRKDGYQTLKTKSPVIAPWWQWVPFDLVAELIPAKLEDPHTVSFTLKPRSQEQVDPAAIVERGEDLADQLESSRLPAAQMRPTTKPSKK
jgi:hypothetical protein